MTILQEDNLIELVGFKNNLGDVLSEQALDECENLESFLNNQLGGMNVNVTYCKRRGMSGNEEYVIDTCTFTM